MLFVGEDCVTRDGSLTATRRRGSDAYWPCAGPRPASSGSPTRAANTRPPDSRSCWPATGAQQSRSRRGSCHDNAPPGTPHAEPFWSRLKTELLAGGGFPGLAEARLEISHYIACYNAERRHSSLGYQSPNHFETKFKTTSQLCPAWLDHLKLPD